MKIEFKSISFKWIWFAIVVSIYTVTQVSAIMYVCLAIQLIYIIKMLLIHSKNIEKSLIDLLIVGLILPDNYSIILAVIACFVLGTSANKLRYRISINLGLIVVYLFSNMVLHQVPVNNIVMSLIYTLPFFLMNISGRKLLKNSDHVLYLFSSIKKMLTIEVLSVVIYAVVYRDVVAKYADMDWVTGTLGKFQCNVLMCICSFSVLMLLAAHHKCSNKNILWILLGIALTIATGSVAYLLIYFTVIAGGIVWFSNMSYKKKTMLFAGIIGAFIVFVSIMPQWMIQDIIKLTNIDYLVNRITKLNYYKTTFFDMPKDEGLLNFLFGTGIGQYSSRAAETCAGGYIALYDRFADPYETIIRRKYISGLVYGGDGLMASPASSIISLQGECGFVGLTLVMMFLFQKFLKCRNVFGKISVIYFVGLMFVDNTLEFAKYVTIFWLTYYACFNCEKQDFKQ